MPVRMSVKPIVASSRGCKSCRSSSRNANLLAREDQIWILDHLAVRFEDLRILVRVLVKMLGDRRQRIARLDDVELDSLALLRSLQSVDIDVGNAQRVAGYQNRFLHRLAAGRSSPQLYKTAGRVVVDRETFDAFEGGFDLFLDPVVGVGVALENLPADIAHEIEQAHLLLSFVVPLRKTKNELSPC